MNKTFKDCLLFLKSDPVCEWEKIFTMEFIIAEHMNRGQQRKYNLIYKDLPWYEENNFLKLFDERCIINDKYKSGILFKCKCEGVWKFDATEDESRFTRIHNPMLAFMKSGKREGDGFYYYPSGNLKGIITYSNNNAIKGKVLYENGNTRNVIEKCGDHFNSTQYYPSGKVKAKCSYLDFELKVKDGEHIDYYENGNMMRRVFFKENLEEGLKQEWDPDENLLNEFNMKYGEKHGIERIYGVNLTSENTYFKGVKIGPCKMSTPDGKIIFEGSNRFSGEEIIRVGFVYKYYLNGNINFQFHTVGDVKHGPEFKWDENGNKVFECFRYNGLIHGRMILYHPNGKVNYIGYLFQGIKNGKYEFFSREGVKIEDRIYRNDKIEERILYENGSAKVICFIKGEMRERFIYNGDFLKSKLIYKNDKMIQSIDYSKDGSYIILNKEEDTFRQYYTEGILHREFSVKNNLRHGIIKEYNKEGGLVYESLYNEGKLIGPSIFYFENEIITSFISENKIVRQELKYLEENTLLIFKDGITSVTFGNEENGRYKGEGSSREKFIYGYWKFWYRSGQYIEVEFEEIYEIKSLLNGNMPPHRVIYESYESPSKKARNV